MLSPIGDTTSRELDDYVVVWLSWIDGDDAGGSDIGEVVINHGPTRQVRLACMGLICGSDAIGLSAGNGPHSGTQSISWRRFPAPER